MQPTLAESSLVHYTGSGQVAGAHIHLMANKLFPLILLEDLVLLTKTLCSHGGSCIVRGLLPVQT